ncbi:substrate-binding periplasmic protein [Spartinivicinus poritis]|uniref:Transporter substrate-binding domain-containing protein n=1 Tax=Spartinivicinus poritis TaxID=2994640 RepID=A0ABT5U3M8_9GAMM|nr:transporter substrate-binding domain-containing protein [Spartinivicinus sp. A2-2]MDE1460961.1 transporter substrate-binding domain-containing protein [Spartinivicinus sp. A2-2]
MKRLFFTLLMVAYCLPQIAFANLKILRSDFRDIPPLMYEQDGEPTGALVDILNAAAEELGYQVIWRKSSMDRTLRDVKTGLVDIIPNVPDKLQTDEVVEFVKPIGEQQHKTYFLVKEASQIEVGRFVTLEKFKFRLGLIQGNSYFKALDQAETLRKIYYRSLPALIKAFDERKIHILTASETEIVDVEKLLNDKNISFRYLNYRPKGIILHNYAVAKGSPHAVLKDKFNKVIQELVESGKVRDYFTKYKVEIK